MSLLIEFDNNSHEILTSIDLIHYIDYNINRIYVKFTFEIVLIFFLYLE